MCFFVTHCTCLVTKYVLKVSIKPKTVQNWTKIAQNRTATVHLDVIRRDVHFVALCGHYWIVWQYLKSTNNMFLLFSLFCQFLYHLVKINHFVIINLFLGTCLLFKRNNVRWFYCAIHTFQKKRSANAIWWEFLLKSIFWKVWAEIGEDKKNIKVVLAILYKIQARENVLFYSALSATVFGHLFWNITFVKFSQTLLQEILAITSRNKKYWPIATSWLHSTMIDYFERFVFPSFFESICYFSRFQYFDVQSFYFRFR